MTEPLQVIDRPLPSELSRVVESGRWSRFRDTGALEDVFGERPSESWAFYTHDEMIGETRDLRDEQDGAWFGSDPDDIDPDEMVVIGDLGVDRPLALDFRSPEPCVRLMTIDARWVVVASSAADLIGRLGFPSTAPC